MKKILIAIAFSALAVIGFTSCNDDDDINSEDREWLELNTNWYQEQLNRKNPDGTPYFSYVRPAWFPESNVLIHYFNDRSKTEGNLQPLLTSTVTVKYKGQLYDGTVFDSTATTGSDTVRSFQLSNLILGWKLALTQMHVGDSVEIIIPYPEGYGATSSSSIRAYSTLRFGMKLVETTYELP